MAHTQKRRTFEDFVRHLENNGGLSWPSSPWLPLLEARNSELEAQAARVQFLEARIAELEAHDTAPKNERAQPNEAERH